jgi:hypothetical protein
MIVVTQDMRNEAAALAMKLPAASGAREALRLIAFLPGMRSIDDDEWVKPIHTPASSSLSSRKRVRRMNARNAKAVQSGWRGA